jgi:hypothetical protein
MCGLLPTTESDPRSSAAVRPIGVTFWAVPTRHVRRHLHTVVVEAGRRTICSLAVDGSSGRGRLILVNEVACGYGIRQPVAKDLRGFLRATQAMFLAATKVEQVRLEPIRAPQVSG